jgi:hypothetical protein
MAIRTFNSVGGFSVGETPETIILANGDITTDFGTFTANLAAGNVKTDHLLYANGVAWDFQQAAGANYEIQYNLANDFGASANFTFTPSTNEFKVIGTANITGNINAANFVGNFVGNIVGNITAPGSNTYVQFNDAGNSNAVAGFTFDKSSNLLTLSGNINAANANLGNVATANYFTGTLTTAAQPNITSVGALTSLSVQGTGSVSGANLVSANYIAGTLTTAAQPNITQVGTLGNLTVQSNVLSGNANLGNLTTSNYFAGVLTTGAQPNITSVGTLSSLIVTGNANVNGNVNAANLGVSGKVFTSLVPGPDNTLTLGNAGNTWSNLYVSNINIGSTTITTTANVVNVDALYAGNNISAGTLTARGDATLQGNATIAGNLTVGGNTTYVNVTTLSIHDPLIEMGGAANGGNSTTYDGKDRGMILHNNYANNDPLNQAFIWKTANSQFEAYSVVSSYSGEDVAGTFGNIKAEKFIGNVSGTILTASQTNITTLGTLTNLTIAGNLQVNVTANINTLVASGLSYPTSDGSGQQVLSTYGNGQLYWATVSTSSLSNGNSNITVIANSNVTISSNGVANVVTVTGTGVNVAGTLNVTGSTTLANTRVDNLSITSVYPNGVSSAGTSGIKSATVTTTSIAANQTIATFAYSSARGAIFDVKGEQSGGTGKYSIATVHCVHDGTNVDYAVSGSVLLNGATGTLAVNIIGSNLYLGVTPTSSNSTVWTAQYRTI